MNKVNKWLDYPKNEPILGEEIVVCYGEANKKEIITWSMKYVGSKVKFLFMRLPPIKTFKPKPKSNE